jgi:ankyrin repeat protein
MKLNKVPFFLVFIVLLGILNQYLGSPVSLRGLDVTSGQLPIAYAQCSLEAGLPLLRDGYPPIEPVPIEQLSTKDRNLLLACALESGSYNFVKWALQHPKERLSIDSKYGRSWPVENVARWYNGRAAADTLALILEPNDSLWSVNGSQSLIVAMYEAATVEAAKYLATKYDYFLSEKNQQFFHKDDYPKYQGLTLAQYHAFSGRTSVAEYFASKGSRILVPGLNFRHWLFMNDKESKLVYDEKLDAFLAEQGVSRDEQNERGYTLLHLAVFHQNEKLAAFLLDHGANPNIADNSGETPLFESARKNQKKIMAMLIEHGGKLNLVNHKGQSLMHLAFSSKSWEAAESLLERNAPLDIRDTSGRTAVFACVSFGCPLMDRLALKRIDFNVIDNSKKSLLHVAAEYSATDKAMLQTLISNVMQINAKDIEGKTALHIAARDGSYSFALLLLGKGADADARDNLGNTPLHLANTSEAILALLESGANPDISNKSGERPVNGTLERTQMLFHSPAHINSKDFTLPRFFTGIRVGDSEKQSVVLNTPVLGTIGKVIHDEDDLMLTDMVEFISRGAALEYKIEKACVSGVVLYFGEEMMKISSLENFSSWQEINSASGNPNIYRASIKPDECDLPPVSQENLLNAVRRMQPASIQSWQIAAKSCLADKNPARCEIFVRPVIRVSVKDGQAWNEVGMLRIVD